MYMYEGVRLYVSVCNRAKQSYHSDIFIRTIHFENKQLSIQFTTISFVRGLYPHGK